MGRIVLAIAGSDARLIANTSNPIAIKMLEENKMLGNYMGNHRKSLEIWKSMENQWKPMENLCKLHGKSIGRQILETSYVLAPCWNFRCSDF